ncbi:MAG: RluA family pseudouridine synthase [Lachnospiraceae bacterium]|nr:RluA family pseudouridine synthase [Lachnospiraceae bacterium]
MEQSSTRILSWRVPPFETAVVQSTDSRRSTAIHCNTGHAAYQQTIEAFLRAKGCSHHVLTQLKRTDHGILRNGEWAYANQPVRTGDLVTIRLEETEPSEQILPVPLPLQIVYEDEDILIADKPCNMPVHPSAGNYENTLANAVMYYYSSRNIPFAFRCITRLDRDTTGLVLIAKNSLSGAILSNMAAKRQIHREYLAITEGILPEEGTIDAPIARQDGSPLMRCVDEEHGERAITHYRRLSSFMYQYPVDPAPAVVTSQRYSANPEFADLAFRQSSINLVPADSASWQPSINPVYADSASRQSSAAGNSAAAGTMYFSLAAIRLETGRTHQIRVHMKSIGHPLPGDFLYNPNSVCALTPRQMLHSHRISFQHPITGETLEFVSEMPEDMLSMFRSAKQIESENSPCI